MLRALLRTQSCLRYTRAKPAVRWRRLCPRTPRARPFPCFPPSRAIASKRNVVVHVIETTRLLPARRLRTGLCGDRRFGLARRLPCGWLRGGAAAAPSEHLHTIAADFGRIAFVAIFVSPLTRLQAAFDVDLASLAQVLAADLGLASEEGNSMPFGLLLLLTALVFPLFRGRHVAVRNRIAARQIADLGIPPQISDEDHFVDRCHSQVSPAMRFTTLWCLKRASCASKSLSTLSRAGSNRPKLTRQSAP